MTDDTAKAILRGEEYDPDDVLRLYTGEGSEFIVVDLADLQTMAQLWLMKRELTSALHFIIDTTPDDTTVKNNAKAWLDKITAIAGGVTMTIQNEQADEAAVCGARLSYYDIHYKCLLPRGHSSDCSLSPEGVEPQADAPSDATLYCEKHGIRSLGDAMEHAKAIGTFYSKRDTSLSLLVIDLGDSCVVKVERGSPRGFEILTDAGFVNEGDTKVFRKSFAAVREAIDGESNLPRILKKDDGRYELQFKTYAGNSHRSFKREAYAALCEIAGHPLPIYDGGTWEQLPDAEADGRTATCDFSFGFNAAKDQLPFKAYRYTR